MKESKDFEYEKKIIGHLIHYYRKKQNISIKIFLKNQRRYYKENCIECGKCRHPEKICSERTLYRIEHGLLARNECIYHRLSENFNKKYILRRSSLLRLKGLRKELTKNIIEYSHSKLKRLSEILEVDLEHHEHEIYVEEMLRLYKDITDYKVNRTVPADSRIEFYTYIKDYLDIEDKVIVLLFLFELGYRKSYISREKIVQECLAYIEHPLLFKIKIHLYNSSNKLAYYEKLKDILLNNFDSLTESQRFMIYDNMTHALLILDSYEEAFNTILKCIRIIESGTDLGDNARMMCYRQAGVILYNLNDFNKANIYFKKSIDINPYGLDVNIALYIHSLEKMNKKDEVYQYLKKINLNAMNNLRERMLVNYYKNKYISFQLSKEQTKYLEDQICDCLKPLFLDLGPLYLNILKEDLLKYVSYTTNYKKLHLFEEIN